MIADDLLVAELDRLEHDVFGHLAGKAFDHGDGVARAGDDQVEIALLHLRVRRHDEEFIADAADAHGAGDFQERNVRDVQGGAGADHAQDIGIVFPVEGEREAHDLHFAEIAGGEERPNGPIDEPAGQDFLGGGPAFAFDEAAGKLAGGVGLLAIIDGERKEVPHRIGAALDGGGQGDGVAMRSRHGTMRLLGEFSGF